MKVTIAILVVLGLLAAIAASVLVALMRVDTSEQEVAAPAVREVEIVVASMALPAGTIVDAGSVQRKTVPQEDAPTGAIRSQERVIGHVLVAPMVEGQVFTSSSFARDRSGLRLAAVIPEGMRAMSVTLGESAALEGLLYPGSHVDVIASFQAAQEEGQRGGRETLSTVLLEGVQVLGVHDRTIVSDGDDEEQSGGQRSGTRRRMVTLLVDSKQAEALQLAASHGTITLALRNPLDATALEDRGTLFSDLSRLYADRFALSARGEPAAYFESAEAVLAKPNPEPEPKVDPIPPPAQVATTPLPPRWKTVVTRGTTEQTLEFAIEEK